MERDLQSFAIKLLTLHGYLVYNNHGTMFTGRGRPDADGCTPHGRYFALEFKDGTKLRPEQKIRLKQTNEKGGIGLEIKNIDEVVKFIKETKHHGYSIK